MRQVIRLFLLIEGVSFAVAGSVHFGVLTAGDKHQQAAIAESTIALVLLIGYAFTWVWPAQTRLIGLVAQAFALLGTLVGVFTIAVGFGPRSVPDLAFHTGILIVLISGLIIDARAHEVGATPGAVVLPWALDIMGTATYLALLLVFTQAVLAGEWLVGQGTLMQVHSENGLAILIVALLQVVLVGLAGLEGRPRLLLAGTTGLFLLLVLVQETLGYAGFAAANQARALHIPNGVLLFGVAVANVQLSRRLRRSASDRKRGV